jgi:hypothetical protein
MKQTHDNAEIIALQALNFIFENEDYQNTFLGNSGISVNDLNADLIKNPETLAAILDYILEEDQTLLSFCETSQLNPQDVWRARLQLPGSPAEE